MSLCQVSGLVVLRGSARLIALWKELIKLGSLGARLVFNESIPGKGGSSWLAMGWDKHLWRSPDWKMLLFK